MLHKGLLWGLVTGVPQRSRRGGGAGGEAAAGPGSAVSPATSLCLLEAERVMANPNLREHLVQPLLKEEPLVCSFWLKESELNGGAGRAVPPEPWVFLPRGPRLQPAPAIDRGAPSSLFCAAKRGGGLGTRAPTKGAPLGGWSQPWPPSLLPSYSSSAQEVITGVG